MSLFAKCKQTETSEMFFYFHLYFHNFFFNVLMNTYKIDHSKFVCNQGKIHIISQIYFLYFNSTYYMSY